MLLWFSKEADVGRLEQKINCGQIEEVIFQVSFSWTPCWGCTRPSGGVPYQLGVCPTCCGCTLPSAGVTYLVGVYRISCSLPSGVVP